MRLFLRAIAIACVPMALSAQARFEGAITARVSGATGGADVTYLVKGDQFRMDMTGRGQSMYILRDPAKNATLMVMPAQRMYMETPLSGDAAGNRAEGKPADIKMTGRKETVAGVECEHVLITSDDSQYDACVAHGLGMFPMINNPMAGRGRGAEPPPAWQKLGRDAFPLKVQKVGGELAFEVTKIERKPLDASLFAVPDGFQKLDMGGMGRMGRPPR
jgi:Domain of unknown function (DUF4412)